METGSGSGQQSERGIEDEGQGRGVGRGRVEGGLRLGVGTEPTGVWESLKEEKEGEASVERRRRQEVQRREGEKG